MSGLNRQKLYDGIYFSSVFDDRFKTNRIAVNFITKLGENTVSNYALLSYLLKKGYDECADFSEFNRHLDELYGASVYSSVSKSGDSQLISFGISGIDDRFTLENENITKKLSEILSKMLLNPILKDGVFLQSEVELEKNTLIDTINAQINDKRSFAISTTEELICKNEPFGINEYGTVEAVKKLNEKDITNAYYEFISTARIEIMFVGCGDAAVSKEIFNSAFSKVKRNYRDDIVTNIHTSKNKTEEVIERFDVSQSKMVLGFACESDEQDVSFALRLMCAVYGGTPMSKLFLNVREKLSLCYYCAARYNKRKSLLFVDCGVESENIEKAKAEILRQLDEIKKGNVTDEEISNALMSMENSFKTINDDNASVLAYYLGQILLGADNTPDKEIELIRKVTKEQIVDAANKLKLDVVYVLTGKEEA